MRINNNLGAMNTYSRLTSTNSLKEKSLEKLSSGLRINRAADDAAGLAISEKMRAQIKGLNQASRNAQDGVSLIQTAEGGLSETHSMLQRMRELAVQGANGTLTAEDKSNIQTEIDELKTEIGKISTNTKFNGTTLLDGSFGVKEESAGNTLISDALVTATAPQISYKTSDLGASETLTFTVTTGATGVDDKITLTNADGVAQTISAADMTSMSKGDVLDFDKVGMKITLEKDGDISSIAGKVYKTTAQAPAKIQVGANKGESMDISISDMSATGLNLSSVDVTTDAASAIETLDTAINTVSTERSKLGAYQNRLEHTMNNLTTSSENITAAESRIRDVDMAKEMMNFTKNNILSQAATSMLAQANQSSQGVLSLLR